MDEDQLGYLAPNAVLQDVLESDSGVPEWVQLTPNRGKFEGRDGRRFSIKSPRALVQAFNALGEDIQIDLDHRSETGGGMFSGPSTEAYGWVTEMAVRNGGQIWARVEWTPAGEAFVQNRTFRGLSPVFRITRESLDAFLADPTKNAMDVQSILSVALTNRPNLRLKSLNTVDPVHASRKSHMELVQLLNALGLDTAADEAAVLAAIEDLKARPESVVGINARSIDLDHYVPRADFDQLNSQVKALQSEKMERAAQAHQRAVDAALTDALKAGKISPASEDYHRASCADAVGLARFVDFAAKMAPIVAPNVGEVANESATAVAANSAKDQEAAAKHGLTVEQFQQARDKLKSLGEIE